MITELGRPSSGPSNTVERCDDVFKSRVLVRIFIILGTATQRSGSKEKTQRKKTRKKNRIEKYEKYFFLSTLYTLPCVRFAYSVSFDIFIFFWVRAHFSRRLLSVCFWRFSFFLFFSLILFRFCGRSGPGKRATEEKVVLTTMAEWLRPFRFSRWLCSFRNIQFVRYVRPWMQPVQWQAINTSAQDDSSALL